MSRQQLRLDPAPRTRTRESNSGGALLWARMVTLWSLPTSDWMRGSARHRRILGSCRSCATRRERGFAVRWWPSCGRRNTESTAARYMAQDARRGLAQQAKGVQGHKAGSCAADAQSSVSTPAHKTEADGIAGRRTPSPSNALSETCIAIAAPAGRAAARRPWPHWEIGLCPLGQAGSPSRRRLPAAAAQHPLIYPSQ